MPVHGSKAAERLFKALSLLGYTILQEYDIGERLRLDYLIRELRVGFECNGIQHRQFTGAFHSSKDAFRAGQSRDRRKAELCAEQGIKLISLPDTVIMQAPNAEALLELILREMNGSKEETDDDW